MEPPAQGNAIWELGDERWSQNLETGAFHLVDFRGLGTPTKVYHAEDVATLTGARVSVDAADRGSRAAALYPGRFKFSPITGKALPEPFRVQPDVWLPPFGGDGGPGLGKPRGLRLTETPLSLATSLTVESRPDVELLVPPPGDYQFLVGAFTTHASALLAIDFSRGLPHAWLPGAGVWQELLPGEGDFLGESSLTGGAWGMAAADLVGSTRVFLPTDHGLAAVSVNLIALSYGATVVGVRCVGAPAIWQGALYVPMQRDSEPVAVHAFDPRTLETIHRLDAPAEAVRGDWTRPIVDRRQIVWMSSAGQLVVKQTGAADVDVSFLPWGPGLSPRFDLGSPYVSADGHVWQQCFQEDGSGGRFVFVQLGRIRPDIRPASSPRLSTGSASFRLETVLRANPWEDPEQGMDSQANEVVIPLLESLSRSTLLCARVPSTSSIDSVFASEAPCTATFELRGEHDVRFAVERLARPWITRPFVFAGCLHLYHPDLPRIPGWRMS